MNTLAQCLLGFGCTAFGYGLGVFNWASKAKWRRMAFCWIGVGIACMVLGSLRYHQ